MEHRSDARQLGHGASRPQPGRRVREQWLEGELGGTEQGRVDAEGGRHDPHQGA